MTLLFIPDDAWNVLSESLDLDAQSAGSTEELRGEISDAMSKIVHLDELRALYLDVYQNKAMTTAVFPEEVGDEYTIIGLANEAGEVLGARKKFLRGDYSEAEYVRLLRKELGDTLWYLAAVASRHGLALNDIARENLDVLADRARRSVIKGSGDDR
jgi:NTP pyrophosphatase (non-canonical NTP hydrolase)